MFVYECEVCGEKFTSDDLLTNRKIILCNECEASTYQYECARCGQDFLSDTKISDDIPALCDNCREHYENE